MRTAAACITAILIASAALSAQDIHADRVMAYLPGYQGGSIPPNPQAADPLRALGAPDGLAVSLGAGGMIELEFTDNHLVNGPWAADLQVIDPDGNEEIEVWVRPADAATRFAIQANGLRAGADGLVHLGTSSSGSFSLGVLAPGSLPGALRFHAVRIVDVFSGPSTPGTPGADIDAVVCLQSLLPVRQPNTPAAALRPYGVDGPDWPQRIFNVLSENNTVSFDVSGAPHQPFAVAMTFAPTTNAGAYVPGIGSLDLDFGASPVLLLNGISGGGILGFDPYATTGLSGTRSLHFQIGPSIPSFSITLQGAVTMPGGGLRLTAAADIDVANIPSDTVYVDAATGHPTHPGNPGQPLRTITQGIQAALASGKTRVVVAEGSYPESPLFVSGITVLGGYRKGGVWWKPTSTWSVVQPVSGPARANNIVAATLVQGLEFRSGPPSATTGHAVAFAATNTSGVLTFVDCRFLAAAGAAGAAGADGMLDAASPAWSGGAAGMGGTGLFQPGSGGSMGAPLPGQSAGQPFFFGGLGGAGGQAAVLAGIDGQPGQAGFSGLPGVPGAHGSAAAPGGLNGAGIWVSGAGADGTSGQRGSGGGGGGGGGAGFPSGAVPAGGNGGHGGIGGQPGSGGRGGQGGGGSFGLVLHNASPRLFDCVIVTDRGGNGGAGGAGHAGSAGLAGAAGSPGAVGSNSRGGAGGNGGAGGHGGTGGGGSGGAGGPSYGVLRIAGASPVFEGQVRFVIGSGGNGGPGGTAGQLGSAPAGPSGASMPVR